MKCSHQYFLLFFLLFISLPAFVFANQSPVLGRADFSLVFEETALFGATDDETLFFELPADHIVNGMAGARLGFEGVTSNGLGFKFTAGYQRLFYSDIGIEEAKKNLLAFDLLLNYYFLHAPTKWDPYVAIGPSLLASSIEQQVFLTTGLGTRFFLNKHWSLKAETTCQTDFEGYWGRLTFGLGYHF